MDDGAVIALFTVNVIGIAGVWHGIDKLDDKFDKFTKEIHERLTRCETILSIKEV